VNLKVEDYFQTGKRSMIRFREKGGKETEIPVHHKLDELLDQYLEKSGLRNRSTAPLFPIAVGKTRKLGNRPATRIDAARMLKRRLKDAGLSDAFSPHSFRATGITNFLENGGTLEVAQRIAGHADSRTTKLYDRRGQRVLLEDMERIRYRFQNCTGEYSVNGRDETMPALRDQVFISYSHKDREWLSKLQTMLKPMVRNKIISVWEDTKISAGEEWRGEIKEALARAKAASLARDSLFS
jgi:hypothetical protein